MYVCVERRGGRGSERERYCSKGKGKGKKGKAKTGAKDGSSSEEEIPAPPKPPPKSKSKSKDKPEDHKLPEAEMDLIQQLLKEKKVADASNGKIKFPKEKVEQLIHLKTKLGTPPCGGF